MQQKMAQTGSLQNYAFLSALLTGFLFMFGDVAAAWLELAGRASLLGFLPVLGAPAKLADRLAATTSRDPAVQGQG